MRDPRAGWNGSGNLIAQAYEKIAKYEAEKERITERLEDILVAKDWNNITIRTVEEFWATVIVIDVAYGGRVENPKATLLHWACKSNQVWVLQQLLVDPQCSLNARCSKGLTAFEWAVAANSQECIDIFVRHEKSIIARDEFIKICMALAREENNSTSQSPFAKLPRKLLLHILSFWNLAELAKTKEQGMQCAVFIFEHIHELNQLQKQQQGLPIIENKKLFPAFRLFKSQPTDLLAGYLSHPQHDEMICFLKYVIEGNLGKVKEILDQNQALASAVGTVRDLSDRIFINFTGLQYAVWVWDDPMSELISNYLTPTQALLQLDELKNHKADFVQKQGAHFDFQKIINRYSEFINNTTMDSKQRLEYWCKQIGGIQKEFPAWLVYALRSRENFKMRLGLWLDEWFKEKYGCGVLGLDFAFQHMELEVVVEKWRSSRVCPIHSWNQQLNIAPHYSFRHSFRTQVPLLMPLFSWEQLPTSEQLPRERRDLKYFEFLKLRQEEWLDKFAAKLKNSLVTSVVFK